MAMRCRNRGTFDGKGNWYTSCRSCGQEALGAEPDWTPDPSMWSLEDLQLLDQPDGTVVIDQDSRRWGVVLGGRIHLDG